MPPTLLSIHHRPWIIVSWATLAVSLLTVVASINGQRTESSDHLLALRFEAAASASVRATQERVRAHDALLADLALHFNYLGSATRERFAQAVVRRSVPAELPAIDRLGYVTSTPAGDLQAYEFGADGRPIGSNTGFSRVPAATLERPLGYARDFNTLGLSARVSEDAMGGKRGGVMMVKPVYDNTTVGISRGSRREHHRGWIYALVDTGTLLDGVQHSPLGPLDIRVYDGLSRQGPATLLYGTHPGDQGAEPAAGREQTLESVRPVGLASRAWTQVVRLGQSGAVPVEPPAAESPLRMVLILMTLAVGALWYGRVHRARQRRGGDDQRAF